MREEGAGPDGSALSDGLGRESDDAKVTRWFGLRLADESHHTSIEVAEISDGTIQVTMTTERKKMEPLRTAFRVSPKSLLLLTVALDKAAHDQSAWRDA